MVAGARCTVPVLWIGISVRPGPVGQLGLEDVSPS